MDCLVATHGARQLELNVAYPLPPADDRGCYELDLFIFTPPQLGLTAETYGVGRFLQDLRSYVRYTVPSLSLRRLTDPACGLSPITRITAALAGTSLGRDLNETTILYELRMLTCIHHRQLRDTRALLREAVLAGARPEDILARIRDLLADMDAFLAAFRALRPRFLDPHVSEFLRESLRWADEAVSVDVEKTFFKMEEALAEAPLPHPESRALLLGVLGREQDYRRGLGYTTVVQPDRPVANEDFLYRESTLKKWAEACLYMGRAPNRITTRLNHVFMGVAAGAAMAFAVAATLAASIWFPLNSLPWIILIVAGYIAKDRIKESLRAFFAARLPRLVADQIEELYDPPHGSPIGRSRVRVRFCAPADLPEPVRQLRNRKGHVFRDIIPPENVVHFHKEVALDAARLRLRHQRLESLTEILRLKLDAWFANMDDPHDELRYVRDGRPASLTARRTYHINFVVRLTPKGPGARPMAWVRHRLILTRNGIVRVENLGTLTA
jgi:hypothetical protein